MGYSDDDMAWIGYVKTSKSRIKIFVLNPKDGSYWQLTTVALLWYYNNSFDYDFELAKGNYTIKISTDNDTTGGTFTLKTSFSKTANLSFSENFNDELFYADDIDFEKVIRGHLAINNTNDYYKIEVPFEKEYVFITNKADKKNFTQILYDESGKQVVKYTTTGFREYKIKLNKGIYYYRITNDGHSGDLGTYSIKVTGHVHSYKTTKRVLATPGREALSENAPAAAGQIPQ